MLLTKILQFYFPFFDLSRKSLKIFPFYRKFTVVPDGESGADDDETPDLEMDEIKKKNQLFF